MERIHLFADDLELIVKTPKGSKSLKIGGYVFENVFVWDRAASKKMDENYQKYLERENENLSNQRS